MFKVQLEKFEGPLDLLLKLIEEQKLDITRLNLAKVADDYLEYIRANENISLENLAEFVNIASRIILIKSQNILPSLEITAEEEKEIVDLENQLREYQKFKKAGEKIGETLKKKRFSFSRDYLLGVAAAYFPPKNVNVFDLKKAFLKVVSEIVLPEKMPEESVREIITLEDKIEELKESLQKRVETSFRELSSSAENKIEIIVAFLAMLEMVKQRIIDVEQNELFDEIKIAKVNV
ncbi:MAG TPA: segregation/condensation protein A [Candidatus Saccharimonadales bacterium]|nr:segregation/condensation protein A [Candidatus Saccharimonadales bacterium]